MLQGDFDAASITLTTSHIIATPAAVAPVTTTAPMAEEAVALPSFPQFNLVIDTTACDSIQPVPNNFAGKCSHVLSAIERLLADLDP